MRIWPNRDDWNARYRPALKEMRRLITPRVRFRLTLADSLVILTIAAVGLMFATQLGYEQDRWPEDLGLDLPWHWPPGVLEGLMTAAALVAIHLACRAECFHAWWRRSLLLLLALGLLWFASVDFAVHHRWCQDCHRRSTDLTFRFYRWPVWAMPADEPYYRNLASNLADELGVPCLHRDNRYQFLRMWGLLAPYPAVCGTLDLAAGDEPTMDELRPYLQAMVHDNPNLPAEFHREAIIAQNSNYIRQFMAELRARVDAGK